MKTLSLLWCGVLAAVAAQAQVHRCTDAVTGKVLYSDAPCVAGQQGALVEPARSAEQIQAERARAAAVRERQAQEQAARRAEALAPVTAAARAPLPSRADQLAHTPACREAKKEVEFVASIRTLSSEGMRARMNAATASVNASCGTHLPLQPEPVAPAITRCDANFCYDAQGTPMARDPLAAPAEGTRCSYQGGAWICQ